MDETSQQEEFNLIRRCRDGDRDSFAALVNRYASMVYTVAHRMTGDAAAADDLAQETFLAAYGALGSFQFGSKFSSWLYSIVLNKCRDYLRTRKPSVSVDDLAEVIADCAATPEQRAASREAGDVVQAALGELPPEYREVLILKHIEGLSYEEIAALLGVSEGALKVRACRGRELLRSALAGMGVTA